MLRWKETTEPCQEPRRESLLPVATEDTRFGKARDGISTRWADPARGTFEKGSLHFAAIDTQQPLDPESDQRRWLETDLAQAQAAGRFIIPFFPKAIFSIGHHAADDDVLALKPVLHSLFKQHGVRLVFEGHDHVYYRTLRDSITYVVTGGGGAPLYDPEHPELGLPQDVFKKVNHFCVVDVYADRLEVTAYQTDLTELDRFTVAR